MRKKTTTSTYQPGQSIDSVMKKYGLRNVVKLASNENPYGPSPKSLAIAKKISNSVNRYPDSKCYDLKYNLVAYINKPYIKLNNIIIGNGSNEILELAARAFLNPNTSSIASKHAFAV